MTRYPSLRDPISPDMDQIARAMPILTPGPIRSR